MRQRGSFRQQAMASVNKRLRTCDDVGVRGVFLTMLTSPALDIGRALDVNAATPPAHGPQQPQRSSTRERRSHPLTRWQRYVGPSSPLSRASDAIDQSDA